MAEKNYDELDHALDAALAKYSVVEPRAGLEERILASLRTAPEPTPDRAWWRWRAMTAVAAVLLVAVALGWRAGMLPHPFVADSPSLATQDLHPGKPYSPNLDDCVVHPPMHHVHTATHQARLPVAAAVPKLDQFPSPLPLSEQEKILASYVSRYPEHAVLVARARAAALLQDQKEELRTADEDRESQETNQ